LKIIQWATGAMGRTCLQAVIDAPHLELVGLYVYGDRKAGRDAGDIARREPTGITATRDVDEILALNADVVIHAARLDPPFERHDADICRLLRSGKNVISLNGGTNPAHWPEARRAQFEAAGREGGATFMGAGLNPGFAAEKLAVLATGVCSRVDAVSLHEVVDCRAVKSPEYVFDVIGFGAPVDRIDPNDPNWGPAALMSALFEEVVTLVTARLGWRPERVTTAHRLRPATTDLEIAAGTIKSGTAARIDWMWHAHAAGQVRVKLGISWTMEKPAPEETASGLWNIRITGEPDVSILFGLHEPDGWTARTTAEMLGVAGAVTNAIPHVIAAAPGVAETPPFVAWRAPEQAREIVA
jgi:2,4-diaminopentanoate dehydrogenase